MIDVWNFDIVDYRDWVYIWHLWINGWVVDEPDELLFFGLVLFFLPLWLTGWTAISSIKWEKIYRDFMFKQHKKAKERTVLAKLAKMEEEGFEKQEFDPTSLLTIERPRPIGGQLAIDILPDPPLPYDSKERKRKEKAEKKAIKAATKQAQKEAKEIEEDAGATKDGASTADVPDEIVKINSVKEILTKVGYELIENVEFADCKIDYVAISKSSALLCLVDKDKGDWLADEESFGGEEPLWFSESKHRGSPIFKVKRARDALVHKLTGAGIEVTAVAIIKEGTIINGQDMLNNWLDMNVMVCRIGNGGPDELPSFALVMKGNKADPAKPENIERIKTAVEELTSGNNEMLLSEEHEQEEKTEEPIVETKKTTGSKISLSKKPKTEEKSPSKSEDKEEDSVEARLAALAKELEEEDRKEKEKKSKEDVSSKEIKGSEEKPATTKKVVKRVVKKPADISADTSGSKKKVVKKVVRRRKVAKPDSLTDNVEEVKEEKPEDVETTKISEEKTEQPKRKNRISLKKN
jgi:hypothetical protein